MNGAAGLLADVDALDRVEAPSGSPASVSAESPGTCAADVDRAGARRGAALDPCGDQRAVCTLFTMLRAGVLVVGLVLLASPALAQALPPDPARLDYARPKNLAACPEEWYFRAFVAGRFGGVDPFTPNAPRRIALTLGRRSGAFVATLDMYDSAGAYLGGNEKPLVGPDCQRLVDHAGGIVAVELVGLDVSAAVASPSS